MERTSRDNAKGKGYSFFSYGLFSPMMDKRGRHRYGSRHVISIEAHMVREWRDIRGGRSGEATRAMKRCFKGIRTLDKTGTSATLGRNRNSSQ